MIRPNRSMERLAGHVLPEGRCVRSWLAYADMIRSRCVYLNTITWSMHSRRTEPINRSTQKGLGVRGAAWCRRWSVRLRRGIDHGFAAKGPGAQKNTHNGD